MPEISVIVPVYNTGRFLNRCVDSILAQTFSDLELFLVDDGSTDLSGKICDEYAAKDSRVRVIHQENQGQSVARNQAISQMEGNWVHFVDSDDWIHPQMLEYLYRAAMELHTDISVCGFGETTGEFPQIPEDSLKATLWTPRDFYKERFLNATVPVAKLIRREVLGDHRFPVGKYIDDEFIMYRVLFEREQLAYLPAPLYAYYVNPESLTKRAWNPRRLDAWEAYEQQIAFFENRKDTDMVRFRYRGYLENGMVNLQNAEAENGDGSYDDVIRFMEKRMRSVIHRAWKAGEIRFWPDYDMLNRFYPLGSRIGRRIVEWKVRHGRKANG